jgi:putative transposase
MFSITPDALISLTWHRLKSLFIDLKKQLKKKRTQPEKTLVLFPLDSTIIALTSKLLWQKGYYQVKLFSGLNLLTAEPDGIVIHFGQRHDNKYGDKTIAANPDNGVCIMDRGFCKLARIQVLLEDKEHYFLMRIRNDITLKMLDNGNVLIGTGIKQVDVKVVTFSDLESGTWLTDKTRTPSP